MRDERRISYLRYITFAAIAAVVAIGGMSAYPKFREGQKLKETEAELRLRIDEKNREIAKLKDNQRRFQTDADFVESIARQNRRVFPGELVFIFED